MHGRQDVIGYDRGRPDPVEPPLGRWGWAALIAMIYLPGAATIVLFIIGGVLCRHGNVPIWDRLLGPVAAIAFGWTFLGAGIWDLWHRRAEVRQSRAQGERSRTARWADALLPVVFGAGFIAIGIWILFLQRR